MSCRAAARRACARQHTLRPSTASALGGSVRELRSRYTPLRCRTKRTESPGFARGTRLAPRSNRSQPARSVIAKRRVGHAHVRPATTSPGTPKLGPTRRLTDHACAASRRRVTRSMRSLALPGRAGIKLRFRALAMRVTGETSHRWKRRAKSRSWLVSQNSGQTPPLPPVSFCCDLLSTEAC
jgi:hypothetical protein